MNRHVHRRTGTHTHTYIYTHIHIHMHTYIRMQTHTHMYIYIYTCIHVQAPRTQIPVFEAKVTAWASLGKEGGRVDLLIPLVKTGNLGPSA